MPITQVSIYLYGPKDRISGFRIHLTPDYHLERNWWEPDGRWETRDIPEGYEIVGMFANDEDEYSFLNFGFYLLPIERQFTP